MKHKVLFFLLFFFSHLFGADDAIRVYLNTANVLQDIYMSKTMHDTFDEKYCNQVEAVFRFDFHHNGQTKVLPQSEEKEKILQAQGFEPSAWNPHKIAHIILINFSHDTLKATVFSSHSKTIKEFSPLKLSGILKTDRGAIHCLSDAIYESLYGKPGIAKSQILYCVKEKKNDQWISELWVCDFDGHNARQLTYDASYLVTPACCSVNGNPAFLYVSYQTGQPKIFLSSFMNPQKRKKLVPLKGNQLLPAINHTKHTLAFISDITGSADLFIQDFYLEKGTLQTPIQLFSYPRSTQASPTFHPDGSKIAFVSNKDGSPRIYVIPTTRSSKRATPILLTKQNEENTCPSWSPDGKKLAYSAKVGGIRQIWIYDFETHTEWQLTGGPGNKENPSWAPNSNHIVFNSTDGHISELYLVNLHQPNAVKISRGSGIKHYPAWKT